MIRSIFAVLMVVFSFNANSALITSELTEDNYITYGGLDWTWVSGVSTQDYYNTRIYAPEELRPGWRYATDEELNVLITEITLDMFAIRDINGAIIGYKHSVEFWNENTLDEDRNVLLDVNINPEDFDLDKVNSNWEEDEVNQDYTKWDYETFYVRGTQVTEPGTLFLLAISLIGISLRARRS